MAYNGSYSVFIFILSIYATLSFLYLHRCVKSAAPSRALFAPTVLCRHGDGWCATLVMPVCLVHFDVVRRRQWDPGIPKHSKNGSKRPHLLAVPTNPTISFVCYSHPVLSHFSLVSSHSAQHRHLHPRVASRESCRRDALVDLPIGSTHLPQQQHGMVLVLRFPAQRYGCSHFMPNVSVPVPLHASNDCRGALLSRLRWSGLWSLIPLLFHYFHPVLSRPTVPNIHA